MPELKQPEIVIYPDGRLDRRNASAYLGCSVKTLAMHACTGTGPKFIRLGGKVFYFKDDLDAWIASHPKGTSTAQLRAVSVS